MAKTAKSLVAAAVFGGGLLLGMIAMAGLLLATSIGLTGTENYTTRSELTMLDQSPVVEASLTPLDARLQRRSSDSLNNPSLATPARLVIPAINLDAVISSVGLEPTAGDASTVAVPARDQAGWYEYGSAPGQPGATVLAGHLDLDGLRGVFWSLDNLSGGETVEVHMSDESIAFYRVIRGTTFSRDSLPTAELFRQDGAPALHLITCGGAFNQNLRSYESNLVVTAAPIYAEA